MTTEQVSAGAISEYVAGGAGITGIRIDAGGARPVQNWVLDPVQDMLLIIVAPLITLVLALAALKLFGSATGATLILLTHVVFTVAHHLPTFIRIYGDVELFRRHRWHFVFAPLIAFAFAMAALVYINVNNLPLDSFLYLYIILTLWDPWHFMRQHYGFMRIYDRHNAAPRWLASRLDLLLSIAWFAYIMLASGDWLLDLLTDFYARVRWPFILGLSAAGLERLVGAARAVAFAASGLYLAYLLWCWRKNYFVSTAKIALCAVTFGVMYLTYTPNALIQSLAPGWSFKVGFAVIGIVHMTQYLAIVWRYNRNLTHAQRARTGAFRWLHSRKGGWAAAVYVSLCLAYGDVLTTVRDNEWLMAGLLALGFTSTMMHYYFDGFIWKMRHPQNRETLFADIDPASRTWVSWRNTKASAAACVLLKQLLYFAVPMAVLTAAAVPVWSSQAAGPYLGHMYRAQKLSAQGLDEHAAQEARIAYAAMQAQLPLALKTAELQASSARLAELAFLIYNESLYWNLVMPALENIQPGPERLRAHRSKVEEAARLMKQALDQGGALAHAGREKLDAAEARRILASWRKQVG